MNEWKILEWINITLNYSSALCLTRELFIKPDDLIYKEGDLMKRVALADTLEKIQNEPDTMYTGALAKDVVDDIKDFGEDISFSDLFNLSCEGSGKTNIKQL